MHPRAQQLIDLLQLEPHPEGGVFREIYRSASTVTRTDGAIRSALTTIYFLLPAGAISQWHRVAADEVWHFYEGGPLCLHIATGPENTLRKEWLGPVNEHCRPVRIVPAQAWQAAVSSGPYTLVGCSVAPGFEFSDFTLLDALKDPDQPTLPMPSLKP